MKPEAADSPEVGGTALLPRSRDRILLAASVLGAFLCGLALHDKGIVLGEEGQILAEAEAILRGKVLYRDIDAFVAPGVWYLGALIFKIAGTDLNATRWAMVLLSMATAALIYLFSRQVSSPAYAFGSVLFFFALRVFSFPLGNFLFYTEFSLFFGLAATYGLLRARRGAPERWLLATGLAAALAFLFKQNIGGIAIIVVAGFALVRFRRREALVAVALPPAILLGGILLAFLAVGALPALYHGLVVVPFTGFYENLSTPYWGAFAWARTPGEGVLYLPALYIEQFLLGGPRNFATAFSAAARATSLFIYLAPGVLIVVVFARAYRRRRLDDVETLLLAAGLITFSGAFPRSDFPHVAQGMTGFIPLLAYLVGTAAPGRIAARVSAAFLALTLGLAGLLVAGIAYDNKLESPRARLHLSGPTHNEIVTTLERMEELIPRDENMSVIPSNAIYYFLDGRPVPHRYTIMLAHIIGGDGGQAAVSALQEGKVDWIVYSEIRFPGAAPLEIYAPTLAAYIHHDFEQVHPPPGAPGRPGSRILRRRDQSEAPANSRLKTPGASFPKAGENEYSFGHPAESGPN